MNEEGNSGGEPIVNMMLYPDVEINGIIFPPGCREEINYVDGKKEGLSRVFCPRKTIVAKLRYHNDILTGECIFNNEYGEKIEVAMYENNQKNGWYCEYERQRPARYGIYKNGEKFSELKLLPNGYFEERKDGTVISVCQFNKGHKRDGKCYVFVNGTVHSAILFEDGKEIKELFKIEDQIMTEYGNHHEILYKGGYTGDITKGFSRSGEGSVFVYKENKVTEVNIVMNGNRMYHQVFSEIMKEYDASGICVYEGEFEGDVDHGFVRSGYGITDPTRDFVYGLFNRGQLVKKYGERKGFKITEVDEQDRIVYIGDYSLQNGKVMKVGKGKSFEYNGERLVKVFECEDGEKVLMRYFFSGNEMTIKNENGRDVYCGGFKGDVQTGFIREGFGDAFDGMDDLRMIYKGNWVNDKREGKEGRFYIRGELKFKGEWKADVPNGHGCTLDDRLDPKYIGVWEDGYLHLKEREWVHYIDGEILGDVDHSKPRYKGSVKDKVPEGTGVLYGKDGKVLYEGQWKRGWFRIRKGLWYYYVDDQVYGTYLDGKRKYQGEMEDYIPHGVGEYLDHDGNVLYKGNWDHGWLQIDEFLQFHYTDDCIQLSDSTHPIYRGGWENDRPSGQGMILNRQGDCVYEGEWQEGELLLNQETGEKVVVENNRIYLKRKGVFCNQLNGMPWKEWMSTLHVRFPFQLKEIGATVAVIHIRGCNGMEGEVGFCDLPNLQAIVIESQSLMNISRFVVRQNTHLKRMEVKSSETVGSGSFSTVISVTIASKSMMK